MKRLFLVRGLPGSGKTTLAHIIGKSLAAQGQNIGEVCTDQFFEGPEGYEFNGSQLEAAHSWTQDCAALAMRSPEYDSVIVHNTFSRKWEAEPYMEMAEKYGYEVFVVETQNDFGSEHDVPQHTVENMKERWEPLS